LRRSAALCGLLIVLAACGGVKPAIAPTPAAGAPKFPDFVVPAAPADLAPADVAARQTAAWQLLQSGDARAADREFAAVLKQAPGFYPAEAGLGYSALARHDNAAAVGHFDRALSANPAYAPALAGKGDALAAEGRADAALSAYEGALAADSGLASLRTRIDALRFRSAQDVVASARRAADAGRLD